jgi:hypothetical protein
MGADSAADQYFRVSSIGKGCNGYLVKSCAVWEGPRFSHFRKSEPSYENKFSVPRCLEDLTRGELWNVELLVRISDVSSSSDHLLVKAGNDSLDSQDIAAEHKTLKHVDLSSLQVVILVLLVPESVLVEPVIDFGSGIKGVSEVGGSGWCDPEFVFLVDLQVVDKLFVFSFIVFLDNSEVSALLG